MYLFKPSIRRCPRLLADDTGSATVEWTVAVAIVVMMAVPVMSMIGAGSENQSREIAVSIQDAEQGAGRSGGGGLVDEAPEYAGTAPPPDREPGSDLGIGYSGLQTDVHASPPVREVETLLYPASFGNLRRDKPVERAPRLGNAIAGQDSTALPRAGSGVNLPRMPRQHVVSNLGECMEPIDAASITEARFMSSDVVMSGR